MGVCGCVCVVPVGGRNLGDQAGDVTVTTSRLEGAACQQVPKALEKRRWGGGEGS